MLSKAVRVRQKLMASSYNVFQTFKEPVEFERAEMQYMYDSVGMRYLDLLANNLTISVGHCHPKVVRAGVKQMEKMMHCSTMYYSEPVAELTEKLLKTIPERTDGDDWQVIYAVSGTEAVEIATQLARVHTGIPDILSLQNSYHGSYGTAMGLSGTHACSHPFPESMAIHHLEAPIYHNKTAENVNRLISTAEDTVKFGTSGKIAGFMFEAIQGYGGIHVLPPEYLVSMQDLVHQNNGLMIADEIQTGFGRTGTNYWSFELSGIMPDIITIGKGLGNGYPISAVVAKKSVFDSFAESGKFIFSTYGANPVGCAIGSSVLDLVENEQIMDQAMIYGKCVDKIIYSTMKRFPDLVIDYRGRGMMKGIELNPNIAYGVFERMKDRGILMGLGGSNKNVLRFMPPMCLNHFDLDLFELVFNEELEESYSLL